VPLECRTEERAQAATVTTAPDQEESEILTDLAALYVFCDNGLVSTLVAKEETREAAK
jgi:hypothetical protein